MTAFYNFNFREILDNHDLDEFSKLWELEAGWVEEPNQRRKGWSGVSRIQLQNEQDLYLKRQQNHNTRNLSHPLRGIPTFKRELHSAQMFQKLGIPCIQPLYFAEREEDGNMQAILITKGLMGYTPASELIEGPLQAMPIKARKNIFNHLGRILLHMHKQRIQHSSLYPKHIFIKLAEPLKIKLIDLEKVRHRSSVARCQVRDLYALDRESLTVSLKDKLRFLHSYFGETKLSQESREIFYGVIERHRRHGIKMAKRRASQKNTANSSDFNDQAVE